MQMKPGEEHDLMVGPGYQAVLPEMKARPKSPSPGEAAFLVGCISKPGAYCSEDLPAPIVTTSQGCVRLRHLGLHL